MAVYTKATVLSNRQTAPGVFDMTLSAAFEGARAGQFAMLFVPGEARLLPRPISLCDFDEKAGWARFIYQVAGGGTACFSRLAPGDTIQLTAPLGNGFPHTADKKTIVVAGGGIGAPPLLALVKQAQKENPAAGITVFLGFRDYPILTTDFAQLGVRLFIATDDGSVGFRGTVSALMQERAQDAYEAVYACGPRPMLRAVRDWAAARQTACYVSMEERMACGLGACVGCAIPIKTPEGGWYQKVCADGPVFDSGEVDWDAL